MSSKDQVPVVLMLGILKPAGACCQGNLLHDRNNIVINSGTGPIKALIYRYIEYLVLQQAWPNR